MSKKMRLDKLLSQQTVYSRSEIKKLVKSKRVTVNGSVAKQVNLQIDPEQDRIYLDDELITNEPFIYYVLNKPKGVVSATWDNQWSTVVDLLPEEAVTIYSPAPVGRLDKDTEGLLIITNDGQLNHALMSPKRHVEKEYWAHIQGIVTETHQQQFRDGLVIDGDEKCLPAELFIDSINTEEQMSTIRVVLNEGKYHQVKRMFKAVGCEVRELKRIRIGQFNLPEDLEIGQFETYTRETLETKIYGKQATT